SGERQMQDRGPHFLADAASLVRSSQPGTGMDFAADSEIDPCQVLHADDRIALPDHHGQRPVFGCPVRAQAPPMLQRVPRTDLRLLVGPRDVERHPAWIMDPLADYLVQPIQVGIARMAERKAWRLDPKAEQRPVLLQRHDVTVGCRGVCSYRWRSP